MFGEDKSLVAMTSSLIEFVCGRGWIFGIYIHIYWYQPQAFMLIYIILGKSWICDKHNELTFGISLFGAFLRNSRSKLVIKLNSMFLLILITINNILIYPIFFVVFIFFLNLEFQRSHFGCFIENLRHLICALSTCTWCI